MTEGGGGLSSPERWALVRLLEATIEADPPAVVSIAGLPTEHPVRADELATRLTDEGRVASPLLERFAEHFPAQRELVEQAKRLWCLPAPLATEDPPPDSRLWVPLGGTYFPDSDGFLARSQPAGVESVPTDELPRRALTVLLGEPGSGKTTEMRRCWGQQDSAAFLDIGTVTSPEHFERLVFRSVWADQWLRGGGGLTLILDSLDEAGADLRRVVKVLVQGLRAWPLHRVHVLLSCRTGAWEASTLAELRAAWGEQGLEASHEVLELLPLTAKAAADAANRRLGGRDADFLREVRQGRLGTFACRPVTLRLLLESFGETLPSGRVDLFRVGISRLLEATHPPTRTRQHIVVAGRIAVAMCLSGRWRVRPDTVAAGGDVLSFSELVGIEEDATGEWAVDEEALAAVVLHSPLFSPVADAWHFDHRTFGEYLAADYLLRRGWSGPAGLSLLSVEGLVAPQLEQIAAWLAAMDATSLAHLSSSQPDLLLKTDPAVLDERTRETLTARILSKRASGEEADDLRSDDFANLAHPGLGEQLAEVLERDPALTRVSDLVVRRTAIRMAESAGTTELAGTLLSLAANPAEPLGVRVPAAYAAKRLRPDVTSWLPEQVASWKRLAFGSAGPDDEHDLRGVALDVLWPLVLGAKELVEAVSVPWRRNYFGALQNFLRYTLPDRTGPEALPAVLRLVPLLSEEPTHAGDIVEALLERAVDHFERTEVVQAVVDLVFETAHSRDLPLTFGSDETRRRFVEAVVADQRCAANTLWMELSRFIRPGDMAWVLSHHRKCRGDDLRRQCWRDATRCCLDFSNTAESDLLLNACEEDEELRAWWQDWFIGPVDIDSAVAAEMRKRAAWSERPEPPLITPTPQERVRKLLALSAEDPSQFPGLLNQLTLQPRSTHYSSPYASHFADLPGWAASDEATRVAIVDRALAFLEAVDPHPVAWFGTRSIPGPALAGCCAVSMLASVRPAVLSHPQSWWGVWASTFLELAEVYRGGITPVVLEYAKVYAPGALLAGAVSRLQQSTDDLDYEIGVRRLGQVWSDEAGQLLVSEVWSDERSPAQRSAALTTLVRHGDKMTWAPLLSALRTATVPDEVRVCAAAIEFRTLDLPDDWWRQVQAEGALADGVAHLLADWRFSVGGRGWDQPAGVLADLYRWLRNQYPGQRRAYGADGRMEATGPLDWVVELRDRLPEVLASRASQADVEALVELHGEFPDLVWTRHRARVESRRRSWVPLAPATVFQALAAGPPDPGSERAVRRSALQLVYGTKHRGHARLIHRQLERSASLVALDSLIGGRLSAPLVLVVGEVDSPVLKRLAVQVHESGLVPVVVAVGHRPDVSPEWPVLVLDEAALNGVELVVRDLKALLAEMTEEGQ